MATKFGFQITKNASFAANNGGRYDSIRAKVFGKPLRHGGFNLHPSLFVGVPISSGLSRPAKTLRAVPKNLGSPKTSPSSPEPRRRHPVEYLGYLITNEQQADGNWVANFVRMGQADGCAQCSAAYPASYMAFSDARRQIDAATSSGSTGNRKHERVLAALDGVISGKGFTQECQILDLSQGGARLRFRPSTNTNGAGRLRARPPVGLEEDTNPNPIAVDEQLHLYIKGFGRFLVQVARSKHAEIGVRFIVDNQAVAGLLKALANYVKGIEICPTKDRKEIRVQTAIAAVCRLTDGAAVPCQIIDASTRSMSLRISERPRIGSFVTLGGTQSPSGPPS